MCRSMLRRSLPLVALLVGCTVIKAQAAPASTVKPPLITPPTPKPGLVSYKATPGELVLRNKDGKEIGICPLKHTDVEANIAGFVARVHVKQQFRNTATTPVEAVYTFPLPADAAVDDMTMRLGKRVVKGQIKKRDEARRIYEAAKNAGQAAALLDQERPNIFTQSVANLMPGQDVTIEISFVNLLKYEDGQYEWAFPTVVGPRYTGGASAGSDPAKITPPITPQGTRAGHDLSIEVNLDAGLPLKEINSPLHPIDVEKRGANRAKIQLQDVATLPNKDFVLRYKVAGKEVQGGVIAYAPSGTEGGYFTLILQPPDAPEPADVAPKEMVFVLDQTGSQQGWPIEKAKETMSHCLQNLNPGDTFQLIGFTTEVYPCFPTPVPATRGNIDKALAWLKPLAGAGGTDILKAADYALKIPADKTRPRLIVQMTDGYVGNDAEIIQHVAKHRGEARMFPFGVGNSVNRYLIDGMAREGRGVADYVLLTEDGKEHAKKFYERIAQPLLLDVEVDWNGLPVQDVLPRQIPDVFSSGPIILKGRYTRGMKGEITLRGLLRGKPWSKDIEVNLPEEPTQSAEALPTLWAREKIGDIEYEGWKNQISGKRSDTKTQVTDLALEYRLMSAYTSFVAVEQRVVNVGGKQVLVNVPVEMPAGVSYEGVGMEEKEMATRRLGVAGPAKFGAVYGLGGGGGNGVAASAPAPTGSRGPAGPQTVPAPSLPMPTVTNPVPATKGEALADGSQIAQGLLYEKDIATGTLEGQKRLDTMKPEEKRAALRQVKIAPVLSNLLAIYAKENKNGTLQKKGVPNVIEGRVIVQIWLNAWPTYGAAKLKEAGFHSAAVLTPNKLLLGTIAVDKLDALAELGIVRYIEVPNLEKPRYQ